MKKKSYAYTPWAGIRKLIPAPAQSKQKTKPASEPIPAVALISEPAAPPPAQEPGSDPTANRFLLECWLHQHRPDLLAAIRRAEAEAEAAWFCAEGGFPDRLAAAEAALAQAVAAGREAMREALAGPEEVGPEVQEAGQELEFAEVERLFGGFSKVWNLTDVQAAKLEKVFQEKGPVAVQSENKRWWGAEEWYHN